MPPSASLWVPGPWHQDDLKELNSCDCQSRSFPHQIDYCCGATGVMGHSRRVQLEYIVPPKFCTSETRCPAVCSIRHGPFRNPDDLCQTVNTTYTCHSTRPPL